MSTDLYIARRERVAIQVWEKWTDGGAGLNGESEDDTMLTVIAAADMAFRHGINDLDWEAATLASLEAGSEQ